MAAGVGWKDESLLTGGGEEVETWDEVWMVPLAENEGWWDIWFRTRKKTAAVQGSENKLLVE